MTKYDHIIVGSGASGLTAALLLAQHGRRVLLVEKAARIGGALARFRTGGIPFDVGFHFTGGLNENGFSMLSDILQVLGMREQIEPIKLPEHSNHRVAFSNLNAVYDLPAGTERNRRYLQKMFPTEINGINAFFDKMTMVCQKTESMDIRHLGGAFSQLPEDWTTLQQVLDKLTENKVLQALLSVGCMCYGSRPDEVSFADHCRMAFGLCDSTYRVKHGGDAFVEAFAAALDKLGVEIKCRTEIVTLHDIQDRKVHRFCLSDGSEVTADSCIFTIHPQQILKILPADQASPAFCKRVAEFEPSIGFFSIFGTVQDGIAPPDNEAIFSVFPDTDVNRMLTPNTPSPLPLVMLGAREIANGRPVHAITAFEVSFHEEMKRWAATSIGRRGQDYLDYKAERAEDMRQRLTRFFPWMQSDFKLMATGSMLTFRDYLNSPFGTAYGIRQKIGQFNLIGKLPIVNLYAAGQSSILPGVLGAMTSSFFVARAIIGKNEFQSFIEEKLCR